MVVECLKFKEIIKICNIKAIIPSADTVRNDILEIYKGQRIKMQNIFQVNEFN